MVINIYFFKLTLIREIISNIIDAATIDVMLFGWSFVGIKQTTSPPITFLPFRLCKIFIASSIENPLNAGSKFAAAGATEESRQSKSKVTKVEVQNCEKEYPKKSFEIINDAS